MITIDESQYLNFRKEPVAWKDKNGSLAIKSYKEIDLTKYSKKEMDAPGKFIIVRNESIKYSELFENYQNWLEKIKKQCILDKTDIKEKDISFETFIKEIDNIKD